MYKLLYNRDPNVKVRTYSDARQHLKAVMDDVCESAEPCEITGSRREESVMMLAKSDYQSLIETAYLFRSPGNAVRLLRSIQQFQAGEGKERELIRDAEALQR